ncbi:MAG: hypothetical protein KF718_08890 [Polyangiaceae bacterium]|nr:hypothetical protein [Polyangiaceae bacterium]
MAEAAWSIDPADPRAPRQEVWDRMSAAERERVVASLPADMPLDLHPPEGDPHRKPKERARDALDSPVVPRVLLSRAGVPRGSAHLRKPARRAAGSRGQSGRGVTAHGLHRQPDPQYQPARASLRVHRGLPVCAFVPPLRKDGASPSRR